MDCAECGLVCTSGKCHTTGVGVGRHRRMYWVCPGCAEDVLDFSVATELKPHWLDTVTETALRQRWGKGTEVTAQGVLR